MKGAQTHHQRSATRHERSATHRERSNAVIVRRITKLRQEAGLTKFALGILAHIHPSRVGQTENGHVVPYPVELERLARALGWEGEPAALLDEVESGEPDGRP